MSMGHDSHVERIRQREYAKAEEQFSDDPYWLACCEAAIDYGTDAQDVDDIVRLFADHIGWPDPSTLKLTREEGTRSRMGTWAHQDEHTPMERWVSEWREVL